MKLTSAVAVVYLATGWRLSQYLEKGKSIGCKRSRVKALIVLI